MIRILIFIRFLALAVVAGLLMAGYAGARDIPGITGPAFTLVAKADYISNPDGSTLYTWGYADGSAGGVMQYPGPTLIVNQGDIVTVSFTSELPLGMPSSIVFPGQSVTTTGGSPGVIVQESTGSASVVVYEFVASNPGTYQYHSGTNPDLQVQMGLIGAIIVRPNGYDADTNRIAYETGESEYDHEYLFLLSEMDNDIHLAADVVDLLGLSFDLVDTTNFNPVYWFINGRSLPDTVMDDNVGWLPNQPYGSFVQAHPGEKVLVRFVGSGVDEHPLHTHGNNLLVIARDGQLLESAPGLGADLSFSRNTTTPYSGTTMDGIFQWTGEGLGWDIYGTDPGFEHGTCAPADDAVNNDTGALGSDGFHDGTYEWCEDHGKALPVILPSLQDMTFGGFWSGSPFLGHNAALPPGDGGLNPSGGFTFPWHSHHEKEVINFDVFPGGMFTVFIVQPNSVPID